MYLLILESIGTQEIVLIGIIALVVFGPRKLPEMARKMGSMMAEFRKVSGDFRSTWENAVKFDEEENLQKIKSNANSENPNEKDHEEKSHSQKIEDKINGNKFLPEVREISGKDFEKLISEKKIESKSDKEKKTEWF